MDWTCSFNLRDQRDTGDHRPPAGLGLPPCPRRSRSPHRSRSGSERGSGNESGSWRGSGSKRLRWNPPPHRPQRRAPPPPLALDGSLVLVPSSNPSLLLWTSSLPHQAHQHLQHQSLITLCRQVIHGSKGSCLCAVQLQLVGFTGTLHVLGRLLFKLAQEVPQVLQSGAAVNHLCGNQKHQT